VRTPDDVPIGGTWPFNNPFFLITNMAIGGTLGGPTDSSTASAGQTMLDYVRYYQPATIAGPTITPASSISVNAGASASTNIDLTSFAGSGLVYLSCSNSPSKSTCSIETGNPLDTHVLDFRNSPTATATVHIATTANTAATFVPAYLVWATMLGAFIVVPLAPKRWWSQRFGLIACVLAILISATAFQSCGGGSITTGGGGGGGATNGTPTGHYSLTLTAYTVSGDTSTATVPLNVN
jgi:hypothetical protein